MAPASLYGSGVFSTVAIYGGEPFLWERHWRRLTENARRIGLDIADISEALLRSALDDVIRKNDVVDGRARITLFDEAPGALWPFKSDKKAAFLIASGDFRQVSFPFRLTTSPHSVHSSSPLATVKSCNYLEKMLALDLAKARGFSEAVRLNENGSVVSACMANIFWQADGRFYTPGTETGCLPGTTREFVLDNLLCEQVQEGAEALENAEAVFLTSAGLGVVTVGEFHGREFPPADHEILHLLPLPKRQSTNSPD
jgi:branched-subunit amino acid aminotransferase/4-amino-4-deoxychorismate lyase